MLTKKQHELLMFINQRLAATGVAPSFDEMKDALNLRSKSGIHRLISGLEERGFIRRLPHRARALEVVKLPGGERRSRASGRAQPVLADRHPRRFRRARCPARRSPPTARRSNCRSTAASPPARRSRRCATRARRVGGAGQPCSARGEHYALEVAGDSMVDAGILDGDTVIIQRCDTADNGAIVVALVDNVEVTLKRLRRRGASIALEPANQAYETRIFGPDRVKVQGRLVGLLRRY